MDTNKKVVEVLKKYDVEKDIHREQMLNFIFSRVKNPDPKDLLHVKAGFDSGWWAAIRFLHLRYQKDQSK